VNEVEVLDLLLHRYSDMDYILSLEFNDFLQLVIKAFKEREKERFWQTWLTLYPNMDQKNFIPFSQFYQDQTEPINNRPKEEMLSEADKIRKKLKRK